MAASRRFVNRNALRSSAPEEPLTSGKADDVWDGPFMAVYGLDHHQPNSKCFGLNKNWICTQVSSVLFDEQKKHVSHPTICQTTDVAEWQLLPPGAMTLRVIPVVPNARVAASLNRR